MKVRIPTFVFFVLSVAKGDEPIDLPTTLRLAGANAIEVQLAQQKLEEARGNEQQRVLAFIPTLSVGIGYKKHQGAIQEVGGNVFDVSKNSTALGGTAALDLNLGEAIYQRLAAKQQAIAADKDIAAQRFAMQARAAAAYLELVRAQARVAVADDAVKISQGYGKQVTNAVAAGVAFKGDALRVDVQTRRNQLDLEKAKGAVQQASVQLAAMLRLDPSVTLRASEGEPRVLTLVSTSSNVKALTEKALALRPELAQQLAALAAARHKRDAAVKGPWVPTLTAQVFGGGLD
ncbi:MAG: TolC family protein, partial [Verrucomicrobiaceae bacterium]